MKIPIELEPLVGLPVGVESESWSTTVDGRSYAGRQHRVIGGDPTVDRLVKTAHDCGLRVRLWLPDCGPIRDARDCVTALVDDRDGEFKVRELTLG